MESKSKHGREAEHVISELRQIYPLMSHCLAANLPHVKQRLQEALEEHSFQPRGLETRDLLSINCFDMP